MSTTLDPRVRVRPSKLLMETLIELTNVGADLPESLKAVRDESGDDQELFLDDVQWLRNNMRQYDTRIKFRFHEVLDTCQLILPAPVFPPRNPDLEARIQRLKVEQENKEYQRMTADICGGEKARKDEDLPFSKQVKELNAYMLLIVQFVVSVVTAFISGYFAPYVFYGIVNTGTRIVTGIIFGFVVAIADLYFIMRQFLEAEGVLNIEKLKKTD